MSVSRSVTTLAGIILLGTTTAACADKEALGTIETRDEKGKLVETIVNPPVEGCHRLGEGVTRVHNYTTNDLVLYQKADCTEPQDGSSTYVGTQLSDVAAPVEGPWRSFTIVG
ncbi:hypothetical protein ACH4F6_21050 [Streptomyces sp. NPDC017936]|uniref:hypothetical protein n=1 Tax=Streptomyces sp. NPDC017936 TaxID=3365016 RepID=UPI003799A012